MPGVHLIRLECPQITSAAIPGQFIMVRCGEETILRRPLSIHQVDRDKNVLTLLLKVAGRGTGWLSRRQSGDTLDLLGPLGNGFVIDHAARNLLMVAGGIGIAPLIFLAQEAANDGHSVNLLHGAPTAPQLYPVDLIPHNVELITATEDGTACKKGMITDILPDYAGWADQIFACGPAAMYNTLAAQPSLQEKRVQISLEERMGCGLGVCYGCTIKTKDGLRQVCKDGPVFALDDIIVEKVDQLRR
jgi:dihydroorotate dehydrogenase electron transfer subunit